MIDKFSKYINELLLFSIKTIIVVFIFFSFLHSYFPSSNLLLIPQYIEEFNSFLNRNHIKKQLIGSLASTYAVEEKISLLEKIGDVEMVTYAKQHKQSLLCK
jgi:hypothetical protein